MKSKRRRLNNYIDDAQGEAILPPEMFCEVLARLPVESILRFRSVCKSWCRIIQSPYFISLQLGVTKNRPSRFIVQSQCEADMSSLFLVDIEGLKAREIHLEKIKCRTRLKFKLPALGVRVFCDGLLCMASEKRLDPVCVCNPITKESVILPLSRSKAHLVRHKLAFGFDQSSGKYKVIRDYRTSSNKHLSKFQIITLGESSWRQLNPPQDLCTSDWDAAVFWNGSLHWMINDKTLDDPILAFDLSSETFYTIPFHRLCISHECYELQVLGTSLTIVEHNNHMIKIWEVAGNKVKGFSAICREEHDTYVCWNKSLFYKTISQLSHKSFMLQVCFKDNKIVKKDWFTCYAPEMKRYFYQDIHGLPDHFSTVHFKPSFVSPSAFLSVQSQLPVLKST
ncbi:F-box protein [Salix suchowensis]|nr:F-box protein [Salix suchowensis]